MGRMGRFDCKGLKDFQQQLGKLQNPDDFVESCAKELAAPGCFAWWSKEHLSDSTRQVQEKRAVH